MLNVQYCILASLSTMIGQTKMFYDICVVIGIIQISSTDAEFDACSNYTLMQYVDRRAVENTLDLGNEIAINDIFLNSGWYRIQSEAGENMPIEPPGPFHCGTWYPIWLNGTLPSNNGEEKVGKVCLQNFIENCSKTWNIDIKYCPGNYLVYNLVTPITSSSAYCFGTEAVRMSVESTIATNTNNPINSIDPCTQYSLIQYQERRAAARVLTFGKDKTISDDFLANGWYRVGRKICQGMPTSAPESFHCGTWYPIWLNGQLPTTTGQQVQQTVCMQSFTQKCLYSWNIDIKLCDGGYFVYNLRTCKTSLSGYCFGTLDVCAEEEDDDDSQPQNEKLVPKQKEQTRSPAMIVLVSVALTIVFSVVLWLIKRYRKNRLTRIYSKGRPFIEHNTSSDNVQNIPHNGSPPPYRSRKLSVSVVGNFVQQRTHTTAEIFTVKDTNTV